MSLHIHESNAATYFKRAVCRIIENKPETIYGEDLKRYIELSAKTEKQLLDLTESLL